MQETRVSSLGQEDPLEKGMATHSSVLAWRTPQTEEPGGLQSMGSQRIRHDWATNTFTFFHGNSILVFWGTSILSSIVAAPIYIPTNSVGRFPTLLTLSSIYYLWTIWWQSFWLVWDGKSLQLWFDFPSSGAEHLFMCLWPSVRLLWRNVCLDLLFFDGAVCWAVWENVCILQDYLLVEKCINTFHLKESL